MKKVHLSNLLCHYVDFASKYGISLGIWGKRGFNSTGLKPSLLKKRFKTGFKPVLNRLF